MVIDVYGDALRNDCDILCHQVNLQGVMGAGIAAQIADEYPEVDAEYVKFEPKRLGEVCYAPTPTYIIANCFSQNESFETDYNALRNCMRNVNEFMNAHGILRVAFPFHYGCGIASGDWDTVLSIIKDEISDDKIIKIYHRI